MKSLGYYNIQLKLNATAKQIRPSCDNRRGKCTFEGDSLQLGKILFEFAASYTFIFSVYTKLTKFTIAMKQNPENCFKKTQKFRK